MTENLRTPPEIDKPFLMKNGEFSYLIDKIQSAEFENIPFKHIVIENFLSREHLDMIINDQQILRPVARSTEELIHDLISESYEVQTFPGCTDSIKEYLKCYNTGRWPTDRVLLEGFGLTFRLMKIENMRIRKLIEFLNGPLFHQALMEKFSITRENRIETAIQKYLSGYEISPHPDVRPKALTYLVNVNTASEASGMPMHTHLLEFRPEKSYIYEFWKNNPEMDTCWVPWDWCVTRKNINKNNSIVMFSPHEKSLHAIKLMYDHNKFQRTQIYGNLWYTDVDGRMPKPEFRDLEIRPHKPSLRERLARTRLGPVARKFGVRLE